MNVYIEIINGNVEGINTHKRAQGLKHFFLGKGELISTEIPILKKINFACKEGEKIAFIGNNGSGKSSLLKVIAGIYPLKSGQLNIYGRIAAIIEMGIGFEAELSGRQNIKILMLYNNSLHKYSKELEEDIIAFSELGSKIDLPVKTYSSGMLSRLAFSVSIFQYPEILLLDEVFAVGDSHFVNKALTIMQSRFRDVPISILVSHQEDIIRENCDRCILFRDGEIIEDGSPETILKIYNSASY